MPVLYQISYLLSVNCKVLYVAGKADASVTAPCFLAAHSQPLCRALLPCTLTTLQSGHVRSVKPNSVLGSMVLLSSALSMDVLPLLSGKWVLSVFVTIKETVPVRARA